MDTGVGRRTEHYHIQVSFRSIQTNKNVQKYYRNDFYLETLHLTLLPIIVKVTTMLLELSFKIEYTLPGEQLLFTLLAEIRGG